MIPALPLDIPGQLNLSPSPDSKAQNYTPPPWTLVILSSLTKLGSDTATIEPPELL